MAKRKYTKRSEYWNKFTHPSQTDEQETSPVYLCPVCLRKLHHACGIHTTRRVMERYNENRKFYGGIWRKAFPDVEDWYKERVARIDNAL